MVDSIMDNCSFLKKDLDAASLHGHLYAFKYLVKKGGEPVKTDKIVVRSSNAASAAKEARSILVKAWGEKSDIILTKWIKLES